MLIKIITKQSVAEILQYTGADVNNDSISLFEIRCDCLITINIDELVKLRKKLNKPVIFTLRSQKERGFYAGNEQQRLKLLQQLATAGPDYIDVEDYVSISFIDELKRKNPSLKIIRSYHNFDLTPNLAQLQDVLLKMQHSACDVYKVITFAQSSIDNLTIFDFIVKCQQEYNCKIVSHCMGGYGQISRILGKVYGNYFTYAASIEDAKKAAPGLVPIEDFVQVYNYNRLDSHTKIYALLGDPVSHSVGHLYHNSNFYEHQINAVYVKISIKVEQLKDFIFKLKSLNFLNFQGFSITMPHKTAILEYVDNIEGIPEGCFAVNTLKITDNKLSGINTDGLGAVRALSKYISLQDLLSANHSQVLILGSGGAAAAIVIELQKMNLNLTIINRTLSNAKKIANCKEVNCYDFEHLPESKYDIIINTLPVLVVHDNVTLLDWLYSCTSNQAVFMDINYSGSIALKDCMNIDGTEMFNEQAKLQYEYWFNKG